MLLSYQEPKYLFHRGTAHLRLPLLQTGPCYVSSICVCCVALFKGLRADLRSVEFSEQTGNLLFTWKMSL